MARLAGRLAVLALATVLAGCATEERAWKKAEAAGTAEAYRAFLADHGQGARAAEARARLEDLEYKAAEKAGTVAAYQAFAAAHAGGPLHARAKARIADLRFAEAEKAGTLEAYAQFLKEQPEGELAARARGKRQELLFGYRTEVVSARRVESLTGVMQSWHVKEPKTHTGLVLKLKIHRRDAKSKPEIPSHEFVLTYTSAGKKERSPCLGVSMGGNDESDGMWMFNEVDKGQAFTMTLSEGATDDMQMGFLFIAPVDAKDAALLVKEEPVGAPFDVSTLKKG